MLELLQDSVQKGEVLVSVLGDFYEGFRSIAHIGSDVEVVPWAIENPTRAFDDFTVVG